MLQTTYFHSILSRINFVIFVVFIIFCSIYSDASAHGTGSRWLDNNKEKSLGILFYYSTGEPMAWVKVRVYSPNDKKTAFVIARTDRNGKFSFLPDYTGLWKIEAYDEDGHKIAAETIYQPTIQATVKANKNSTQYNLQNRMSKSFWIEGLFGVSLIFNILMITVIIRRKFGRK